MEPIVKQVLRHQQIARLRWVGRKLLRASTSPVMILLDTYYSGFIFDIGVTVQLFTARKC